MTDKRLRGDVLCFALIFIGGYLCCKGYTYTGLVLAGVSSYRSWYKISAQRLAVHHLLEMLDQVIKANQENENEQGCNDCTSDEPALVRSGAVEEDARD